MWMASSISPYWGKNFFSFFSELFSRIPLLITGKESLATDEIQILVLGLLSISCALLGGFLQLRKMAMLANSLSHTILLGIALAFLIMPASSQTEISHQPLSLTALFIASLFAAAMTAFLTQLVCNSLKLQEDASVGLVFTSLFALGVVVVTLFTKNVHLGTEAVMGNPDVLGEGDLRMSLYLGLANIAIFCLFFRQLQITSFDGNLARTFGISANFFHYLLMFLLAATAISAFRAVGVLLVLSFLVAPFLIARRFSCKLKTLLFFSSAIGVLASVLGVALSRHFLTEFGWALSTGGIVTTLLVVFFIASFSYSSFKYRRVFTNTH
jgi:manganese/zinc/iron transport system permease protein